MDVKAPAHTQRRERKQRGERALRKRGQRADLHERRLPHGAAARPAGHLPGGVGGEAVGGLGEIERRIARPGRGSRRGTSAGSPMSSSTTSSQSQSLGRVGAEQVVEVLELAPAARRGGVHGHNVTRAAQLGVDRREAPLVLRAHDGEHQHAASAAVTGARRGRGAARRPLSRSRASSRRSRASRRSASRPPTVPLDPERKSSRTSPPGDRARLSSPPWGRGSGCDRATGRRAARGPLRRPGRRCARPSRAPPGSGSAPRARRSRRASSARGCARAPRRARCRSGGRRGRGPGRRRPGGAGRRPSPLRRCSSAAAATYARCRRAGGPQAVLPLLLVAGALEAAVEGPDALEGASGGWPCSRPTRSERRCRGARGPAR